MVVVKALLAARRAEACAGSRTLGDVVLEVGREEAAVLAPTNGGHTTPAGEGAGGREGDAERRRGLGPRGGAGRGTPGRGGGGRGGPGPPPPPGGGRDRL